MNLKAKFTFSNCFTISTLCCCSNERSYIIIMLYNDIDHFHTTAKDRPSLFPSPEFINGL